MRPSTTSLEIRLPGGCGSLSRRWWSCSSSDQSWRRASVMTSTESYISAVWACHSRRHSSQDGTRHQWRNQDFISGGSHSFGSGPLDITGPFLLKSGPYQHLPNRAGHYRSCRCEEDPFQKKLLLKRALSNINLPDRAPTKAIKTGPSKRNCCQSGPLATSTLRSGPPLKL